jgi:hypothetical protein
VQEDEALSQKIARYDALFTVLLRKSIMRATSHFRNVMGSWKIFHNSVDFESIFESFSPCNSKLEDLKLFCKLTTVTAENFEIGCFI